MARKRTRKESPADVLMRMRWQVSVVIGCVVYLAFKWLLPSMWASNRFLKPMADALAGISWIFAGVFLIIGFFSFLIQRKAALPLPLAVAGNGKARPEWKPPAWAPKAAPIDIGGGTAAPSQSMRRGPLGEPITTKPLEWSIGLIREIEWKRFEDVCQKFYEAKGIRSECTSLGPDGGIDIRLFQDDSGNATSVVQCKAWGERFVGVNLVRELLGVMTHEKIAKAFFMTSGKYSDDAKAFAASNGITLIDGEMLLMMIKRLPENARADLLEFATAGDYAVPTCVACGSKMKAVSKRGGKPDFWGCKNYPKCGHTMSKRRSD